MDRGDAVENQQVELTPAAAKHPHSAGASSGGSPSPNARWDESEDGDGVSSALERLVWSDTLHIVYIIAYITQNETKLAS
jgi:hypothetical protein